MPQEWPKKNGKKTKKKKVIPNIESYDEAVEIMTNIIMMATELESLRSHQSSGSELTVFNCQSQMP